MEIKENILKYADIPFSYSIISLIFTPYLINESLESLLVLSLLSGILASTLEAFNPIKRGMKLIFGAEQQYIIELLPGQNTEERNIQRQLLRAFDFEPVDKIINKISAYSYLSILLLTVSYYIYNNSPFSSDGFLHIIVSILLISIIMILFSIRDEIRFLPEKIFISAIYFLKLSGIIHREQRLK